MSHVFLHVFNFGLLVFMSCVNYIIEKKNEIDYVRAKQIGLKSFNGLIIMKSIFLYFYISLHNLF